MIRSSLICVLLAALATAQGDTPEPGLGAPLWTNEVPSLRELSEKNPGNIGLKLRLARALLQDSPEAAHPKARKARAKEAESTLESVLAVAPNARVPLEVLTLVEYRWGDYDKVVSLGERLLRDYPGHEQVARSVMKAFIRLKRHDDAARVLMTWLKSGAVHSFGGVMGLMATFSRIPEARDALDQALVAALKERPRDVDLLLFRAAFVAERGDLSGAWQLVKKAEKDGAANLRTGGRPFLVSRLLPRCPEPDPGPASQPGASVDELRAAVKAHPDHAGYAMRLGRLLHRAKAKEEALAAYAQVTKLNPDYWAAQQFLGDLLMDLERHGEAVAPLRRGLELLPGFQPARLRLAQALAKSGKVEEAAAELAVAGRLFAPDPVSRAVMKEAAEKGGEQVVSVLEKRVSADRKNPTLLGHLALARFFAGKSADARKAALEAEACGLVGPAGLPAAIMWEVFEKKPPESLRRGGR